MQGATPRKPKACKKTTDSDTDESTKRYLRTQGISKLDESKINLRAAKQFNKTGLIYNEVENIKLYHETRDQFSDNIKYLIYYHNHTIQSFVRLLNEHGYKVTRNHFYKSKTRRGKTSLLVLTSFSNLFNITPADLISSDFQERHAAGLIKPAKPEAEE
jgi:hypothetical protein